MKKGSRNSGSPGHKRSRKMPRDQRGREGGGGEESRDFSPNTGEILRPKACGYCTRLTCGWGCTPTVLFKPLRKSVNDLAPRLGLLALGGGSFATSVPHAGYMGEFLTRSLGLGAYTKLQVRPFHVGRSGWLVPRLSLIRERPTHVGLVIRLQAKTVELRPVPIDDTRKRVRGIRLSPDGRGGVPPAHGMRRVAVRHPV